MPTPQITAAAVTRIDAGLVDIKITVDGELRLVSWRRRTLRDEVRIDGRVVRSSNGLGGRESVFGLTFDDPNDIDAPGARVLLTVDPTVNWMNPSYWTDGKSRPSGVRIETADQVLAAEGSLDPERRERETAEGEGDWGDLRAWAVSLGPKIDRWLGGDGDDRGRRDKW